MATRIVVMKDGYIQQVGAPKDIYDNPNNIFVGGFIGTPPMNFISGKVEDGRFVATGMNVELPAERMKFVKQFGFENKPVILGIRPEHIHDTDKEKLAFANAMVKLDVDVAELLGAETNIYANVGEAAIVAKVSARTDINIGDKIELAFDMNTVHFFDPESELRIDLVKSDQ